MKLRIVFRASAIPPHVIRKMTEYMGPRIVELAGSETRLVEEFKKPDRKQNPMNKFNLFREQALYEALQKEEVSPSLRRNIALVVEVL